MKKIFYPYKFNQSTWAIVVVMRNIALKVTSFRVSARNCPVSDTSIEALSTKDQLMGRYDILHIHAPTPYSVLSLILSKLHRKPSIFTGACPPSKHGKYFPRYWICIKLATTFCAISEHVKKLTQETCDVNALFVIPNGVDHDFFDPDKAISPESLKEHVIENYFIIIGTICEHKNSLFVLKLAECLPDENFVFVGRSQGDLPDFENKANFLDNVYLVGQQDRMELRNLLGCSKAMLFPTKGEGFGLVAAEALAMNKVVFAQPIEVMKEVLSDVPGACLIEDADVGAWVNALKSTDYSIGQLNREISMEKYSWRGIAEQYEAIYKDLLN